jgi:predicted nucleic acid-binding protein
VPEYAKFFGMPRLYLETSVVSYLTARPSSDIITAAHQLITHRWWLLRRAEFELLTSELVLEEASRGDADAAARRLAALEGIPLLGITASASELAWSIVRAHLLPARAFPDALHISVAAIHSVEYLLTWNCSHIANAELLPYVTDVVEATGFNMPFVCTPEELLGDRHAP